MEKYLRRLVILLIGLVLWMVYICDKEMARYGLYTILSYNTHETISVILVVLLCGTVGWLISLVICGIKQ